MQRDCGHACRRQRLHLQGWFCWLCCTSRCVSYVSRQVHGRIEEMTQRQYSPREEAKVVQSSQRAVNAPTQLDPLSLQTNLTRSRQHAMCCTVWTRSLSLHTGHDNEVRELHLWNTNDNCPSGHIVNDAKHNGPNDHERNTAHEAATPAKPAVHATAEQRRARKIHDPS